MSDMHAPEEEKITEHATEEPTDTMDESMPVVDPPLSDDHASEEQTEAMNKSSEVIDPPLSDDHPSEEQTGSRNESMEVIDPPLSDDHAFEEQTEALNESMEVIGPPLTDDHVRAALESIANNDAKDIDVDAVFRSLAEHAANACCEEEEEDILDLEADISFTETSTRKPDSEDTMAVPLEETAHEEPEATRSSSPEAEISKNVSTISSGLKSPSVESSDSRSAITSRSFSTEQIQNKSQNSSNGKDKMDHSRSSSLKNIAKNSSSESSQSLKNNSDSDIPVAVKLNNDKASNGYSSENIQTSKNYFSSDSSTPRETVNKKKKKKKTTKENVFDSDSDIDHDRSHKHKKKKRDKKELKMSKASKSGDKKKRNSSRTSSFETEVFSHAQMKLDGVSPLTEKQMIQRKNIMNNLNLLVENGIPKLWLINEVRLVLNKKNLFTAEAQDECLDQLTRLPVVKLKRWSTEEIAEATRRKPFCSISSSFQKGVPVPCNSGTSKMRSDTEIYQKEHVKKRKHHEDRDEKHKKHKKDEKNRKPKMNVIDEDDESSSPPVVLGFAETLAETLPECIVSQKEQALDIDIPEVNLGEYSQQITDTFPGIDIEEVDLQAQGIKEVVVERSEFAQTPPEPREIVRKEIQKPKKPDLNREKSKKPEVKKVEPKPPEPKPAPAFKIPKKTISAEQRTESEPDKKKEPVKRMPTGSRSRQPVPPTPKVCFSEKKTQTDPLSGLTNSDGPSVEDLMLLARSQIRDDPAVLTTWSKTPIMSSEEYTLLQLKFFPEAKPKPKISMDAYQKRIQDQRANAVDKGRNRLGFSKEVTDRSRSADHHRHAAKESLDTERHRSSSDMRNRDERHKNISARNFSEPRNDRRDRSPERKISPEKRHEQRRSPQPNGEVKPNYTDRARSKELATPRQSEYNDETKLMTPTFYRPKLPVPSRQHKEETKDDTLSLYISGSTYSGAEEENLLGQLTASTNNPFVPSRLSALRNSAPSASSSNSSMSPSKPSTPPPLIPHVIPHLQHGKTFTTTQNSPSTSGCSMSPQIPFTGESLPAPAFNVNFRHQQQQPNVYISPHHKTMLNVDTFPPAPQHSSNVQQMEFATGSSVPQPLVAPMLPPSNQGVDPAHLAEFEKVTNLVESLSRDQLKLISVRNNLQPYQRFDRDEVSKKIAMLETDITFQKTKLQKLTFIIEKQRFDFRHEQFVQQQRAQQLLMKQQINEQEQSLKLGKKHRQGVQDWDAEQNSPQETNAPAPSVRDTNATTAKELVKRPELNSKFVARTNEEKSFVALIEGPHQIPCNFLAGVCFNALKTGDCPHKHWCKLSHDLEGIEVFMSHLNSLEALHLYLHIRKLNYIQYFNPAFECLQTILMNFHDTKSALVMCYELMLRESSPLPASWPKAVETLVHLIENFNEDYETEMKNILIYILNNKECSMKIRNDVAILSEKTYQYVPEVWSEIFKNSDYVMPKDIFDRMISVLIKHGRTRWASFALEVLVTPTAEEYWQGLSPECNAFLVNLCPNPTVRDTLATKCNKKSPAAQLQPPPRPPPALMRIEVYDDDDTPYSPTDDNDTERVLLVKNPKQESLRSLLLGQEHVDKVQLMYKRVCEAIESYKWREVIQALLNFSGLKLPRSRCLYNALKELVVYPNKGFQKILATARSISIPVPNDSPECNGRLIQSTQNLFGVVGINLMLDLKDANAYDAAAEIYDELQHMSELNTTSIASYRDAPITRSQYLLNAGKICLKNGKEGLAFALFNDHSNTTCNDCAAAVDVAETVCDHFLSRDDFKNALHFWNFSIDKKRELCIEKGIDYELPKYANEMMLASLEQDNEDLVKLWNQIRNYPQHLTDRTMRAITIKFAREFPLLTSEAIKAGIYTNTYPAQVMDDPMTIKMKSFWTKEEVKAVIHDYLTQIPSYLNDDRNIDHFGVFIHFEVLEVPIPERSGNVEAFIPIVDSSLSAAFERAEEVLNHYSPSILSTRSTTDTKLYINSVSLRHHLRYNNGQMLFKRS